MEIYTFEKYLGKAIRLCFTILIFLILVSLLFLAGVNKTPEERNKYVKEKVLASLGVEVNENYPTPWPPMMNSTYPDYELIDQEGKQFKISDFKGKIIILEMVDMSSPISQAYSNAAENGIFGVTDKYDNFSKPIEKMLSDYTNGDTILPLSTVEVIKVIMRTQNDQQPKPKDAEEWAAFFKLKKENNVIVAVPVKDMRGKETDKITPGYQLIDSEMMLRVDSAGITPKHNLEMTLVPLLPKLIGQSSP